MLLFLVFFFFQAEDGIRDGHVTGVQTCALPISQLTVTACLIGLASGQLVAGPLSDRFGRRRPLIVGILAYIAASVLCAFSPGMITLVLARFAQGLAGATGIVIAQASGQIGRASCRERVQRPAVG